MINAHTHEELTSLAALYEDHSCTPCEDASSAALIRPSQIKYCIYGKWQGTLEIHECMENFFISSSLSSSVTMWSTNV